MGWEVNYEIVGRVSMVHFRDRWQVMHLLVCDPP